MKNKFQAFVCPITTLQLKFWIFIKRGAFIQSLLEHRLPKPETPNLTLNPNPNPKPPTLNPKPQTWTLNPNPKPNSKP